MYRAKLQTPCHCAPKYSTPFNQLNCARRSGRFRAVYCDRTLTVKRFVFHPHRIGRSATFLAKNPLPSQHRVLNKVLCIKYINYCISNSFPQYGSYSMSNTNVVSSMLSEHKLYSSFVFINRKYYAQTTWKIFFHHHRRNSSEHTSVTYL